MAPYRILSLPHDVVDHVRTQRKAPRYGHPAFADTATSYGPCRSCLQHFKVGEDRRILFTYDAFHGREDLPLPGPVYIHERACRPYPDDGGFPEHLGEHPHIFNAYGKGRHLIAQVQVTSENTEAILQDLLARTDVDYVHVRDKDAGCYDFTIETL